MGSLFRTFTNSSGMELEYNSREKVSNDKCQMDGGSHEFHSSRNAQEIHTIGVKL